MTRELQKDVVEALRCEEMVMLSLPADVCRCFGGGCADKEHCQRYIARNERWPELSYIQGGAFVNGVCLYRIEPNSPITDAEPSTPASTRARGPRSV